jgi:uncharacterized protein YecE (DUF72 family)
MPKRDWLSRYSQEFNACEISFTFHTLPSPSLVDSLVRKSSPGFQFAIKAHHDMTHVRRGNERVFRDFIRAVEPLRRSGKLGCVLAQFPVTFPYTKENMDYIFLFRERLGGLPLVAEFRHESWLQPSAVEALRRQHIGLCWLDTPPFLRQRLSPSGTGHPMTYVRLQGVEAGYPPLPELRELPHRAEKTFIFTHNRVWAQALRAVQRLKNLLSGDNPPDEAGTGLLPPCPGGGSR